MLWRDNEEKDPALNGKDKQLNIQEDQTEAAQKAIDEVKDLRETIDLLKAKRDDIGSIKVDAVSQAQSADNAKAAETETPSGAAKAESDDEAVKAAHQAVLKQALKDEHERALEEERQKQREAQRLLDQKEQEEALRRAEEKKRETQRLRQSLIAAERKEADLKRRQIQRDKEAAQKDQKEQLPPQIVAQRDAEAMEKRRLDLEKKRQADREKLLAQQRRILAQQRKMLAEEQRKAAENKRREQALQRKRERQQLIEQERRQQRELREQADAEIREIRAKQEAQRKAERQERARIAKEERARKAAIRKQRKIVDRSAELGGGIVNVHGVTVKTEIEPVAAFSLKDLLGIVTRKEKEAVHSEEELKALLEEKERTKEEAREVAARLAQLKRTRRQNSTLGRRYLAFVDFCDRKKKPLLVAFAVVLMLVVGTAGVINYFTVFEYSYNGQTLGYVNDKDNVTQITDIVQKALTDENNLKVVIDEKKDISFKRIPDFHKEHPVDTSDDVLRRLTYMGDLNVKAYGIYIDGKKAGTVRDKETAANVLQDIKDRYKSDKSGTEIEEAVIVEDIQVRRINSDLKDINSEEGMVNILCTSGQKETVHKVVVGETLADIATDYGTTEKELMRDNPGVDPKKLEVGSSLIIKTNGPIMTVKMTEVRNYEKKIKYETETIKDDEMYEDTTEIEQKGKNGRVALTDRTVSVNGEVVETKNLKSEVIKKPVKKIIRVGTMERPPTVGDGVLIWPAREGTYTVTSEFKWRWGRHHDGIDMGCRSGNVVMAADGGTVTYAGYMGGYGNLVIIDHQNGMETYYGHNSSLTVSVGDKVFEGQQIAYSGNTGNSTGPHIHFGVKVNGSFVNPREYLP